MEGKNHIILSSFLWKFSERIIAQFVSLIVSIILARLLSPDNYGVVGIVMVFINIADVFVVSGLSASLVQKKDADSVDFSTIFYCSFVFSIIIYIILFAISPSVASFYNEQSLTNVLRVFSIKIIISSFNSIQHAYVQRKMIFKKFFFSTIIGTLISGIIGIVMSYHNFGVWAIVSQYLANAVIDTVVLFFIVPWRPSLEFSFRSAHELISFGWKVLMTDLISQIFNNIRSFFIGKIYTPADLAYYNINDDDYVVLYAPTFRDDNSTEGYTLSFQDVIKAFEEKTQKKICLLVRFHPNVRNYGILQKNENQTIDVTKYPDLQELVIASDAVISDYSTTIFDFALIKKPVFLLSLDIEDYQKMRGLMPIYYSFPFPFSKTNEQLIKNILDFSYENYNEQLTSFFSKHPIYDKGVCSFVRIKN